MSYIKKDDHKQKWEETEFPLVCETCLGDNPYVRMTKEPHGKKCKICEIPFTVFAWQAGTKGRLKKVEICQTCAKTKNVCQVCIFDLQYGLPVGVRDKILAEHGVAPGGNSALVVPPQSDANLAWFTQSQARAVENGDHGVGQCIPVAAAAKLKKMARMEPRYERNLAKLCSFFARGECNRGESCPFRHELPRDRNDPLAKQNTKDRFYGNNDPLANKMIHGAKQRAEKRKAEAMAQGAGEGTTIMGTSLFCRFGDGANISSITESDIRDKFYSFGEIVSVRFAADRTYVFVEYTSRSSTELAINTMDRTKIGGAPCYVSFARASKRGNSAASSSQQTGGTGRIRPLPAPGAKSDSESQQNKRNKLFPGFVPVKPSAGVLAAGVAARSRGINAAPLAGGGITGIGVPRPASMGGPRKPIYPSTNPTRLGTHRSDK